jgi:hypothetical protein
MVKLMLPIVVAISVIAGCSGSDSQQSDTPATVGGVGVSASDVASATPIDPGKVLPDTLKLTLKEGQVFRYRMWQKSSGGPDSVEATQESTHWYTKRVKKVRQDGSIEVGMTIDSISITSKVANRATGSVLSEQRYRSNDSADRKNLDRIQMNSLLGEEVTLLLSSRGQIVEVSGITPIVNAIRKAVPNITDEAAPQITKQIEMAVYATFAEQEGLQFPLGPLDSARGWSTSTTAPVMQFLEATSTARYTVTGTKQLRGRTLADVTIVNAGSMRLLPIPKELGVSVTLKRNSISSNGICTIDVNSGFTVKKELVNETDLALVTTPTAPGIKPQTSSQRMSMRYTVELLP